MNLRCSQDLGLLISCVVTDDAGQCQRAKRIIALHFPHMYFGKCYAHQVNLIEKDVFKVVHGDLVARVKALTKAYNKNKLEIGREKTSIIGKKGDAGYFEFEFDKRTDIGFKNTITIE